MAESTLSITYAEIQREVAHFLGWPRDPDDWSTDQTTDFGDILKKGLRKFYYPPPIAEGQPAHEWSFLKPSTTLSVSSGDGDYDLPDDFGVIVPGSVGYSAGSTKRRLKQITPEDMVAQRGMDEDTGDASYFAVRQKTFVPATGLRWEILLHPQPDGNVTLNYRYVVAPDTLTTSQYPYGGAIHSETILEAILSCAEAKVDDDPQGVHHLRFMEQLASSVRIDSQRSQTIRRSTLDLSKQA